MTELDITWQKKDAQDGYIANNQCSLNYMHFKASCFQRGNLVQSIKSNKRNYSTPHFL